MKAGKGDKVQGGQIEQEQQDDRFKPKPCINNTHFLWLHSRCHKPSLLKQHTLCHSFCGLEVEGQLDSSGGWTGKRSISPSMWWFASFISLQLGLRASAFCWLPHAPTGHCRPLSWPLAFLTTCREEGDDGTLATDVLHNPMTSSHKIDIYPLP